MSILVHLLPRRNIIAFFGENSNLDCGIKTTARQILHSDAYGAGRAGNRNLPPATHRTSEKTEEKLVPRIMDAQSLIAEERSMGSFLCGFQLALEMVNELNHFEMDRHPSPEERAETDA